MKDTKKTTVGISVKLNKSVSLYHCIRRFINLEQRENEPNDNFKLRWDNVYDTMELTGGEEILRSDQIFKVAGDQESSKETQVQIDEMKAMCFLLSAYQNSHSFLLKQLRYGDNVGRGEYPFTTTSALDILFVAG